MNNMDVMNDHHNTFENLGDFLRYHREIKHFSLEELSLKTKIRIQQLINLEENNFSELPNKVYLKGFIKSICHELDVNVDMALSYLKDNTIVQETIEVLTPHKLGREIRPLHFNFKFFDRSKIKVNEKGLVIAIVATILGGPVVGNLNFKTKKAEPAIVHKQMNIFEAKKLVQPDAVTTQLPPERLSVSINNAAPTGETASPKKWQLNNDIIEGRKVIPNQSQVQVQTQTPQPPPAPAVTPITKAATAVEQAKKKLIVKAKKGTAFLVYRVNGEKKNKIYLRHGKTLELEGNEIRMDVGNPDAVEFTKNGEPMDVKLDPGHASLHLNL